jgi:hypothetical protein
MARLVSDRPCGIYNEKSYCFPIPVITPPMLHVYLLQPLRCATGRASQHVIATSVCRWVFTSDQVTGWTHGSAGMVWPPVGTMFVPSFKKICELGFRMTSNMVSIRTLFYELRCCINTCILCGDFRLWVLPSELWIHSLKRQDWLQVNDYCHTQWQPQLPSRLV